MKEEPVEMVLLSHCRVFLKEEIIIRGQMEYLHDGDRYLLKLQRGDFVMSSLLEFFRQEKIDTGFIRAIGALKNVELGYFDFASKTYLRDEFPEAYELLSFQGNISLVEGTPFCHAHVLLGDRAFHTIGGHLFEAEVAVTFEALIEESSGLIMRKFDPETGLKLWQLG